MSIFWRVGSAGVAVILMLGAGARTAPMAAQQQQPTTPQQPGASPPKLPSHVPDMENLDPGPDPMRASMQEQAIRATNEQRHKKMLEDANRMVQLSNELKADVEKAQKDELSLEVMKKAAEVEKLAHDVQQRMKQ
jgi:hypothetical protein